MPRKYLVNFFFAFLAIFGKKTTLASEINISRVDSDLQKIGVLTVGNFGPSIENTNLTVISRYNQIFFMKQVGQTLVETGPLGEILPGLAQSWTISENGLSYVFKLRLATFHSGHEITARDIVYSLNLAIYSVENVASLYLSDLEGYEDGKATKVCRGIKIIDKNTVSIRLTRSFSPFLKVLSSGSLAITRERSTRSDHDIFDGSGPYKVVKREGDKLFLSAFNV